jgi:hypothetical protein
MRRLRISILDLVTQGPTRSVWGRVMEPNFASIMPQVVGVWCEEAGHDVRFVCYTGLENLSRELPGDSDVLFIGAYTQAAQLAYALSSMYRQRGVITVLGGPHARCYPEDAARYFDYVLGFTDKELVTDVLRDCAPHRPGLRLGAKRQPAHLPGVKERWKFIVPTLAKTRVIKLVPMIGSLGCPYTCSFCIDSVVDYQPLDCGQIKEDLRFLLSQTQRPRVGWHDPNFGVRFDDIMGAIEEAVPPNRIDFAAESSLARSPRSACAGFVPTASRPCCPVSSRGTPWAASRRPEAHPASRRSVSWPTTSTWSCATSRSCRRTSCWASTTTRVRSLLR